MVNGVRRSTLALIRKCIYHISNESLSELIKSSNEDDRGQMFAENLMGVLVTVFNQEDDMEGKEQALLVGVFRIKLWQF